MSAISLLAFIIRIALGYTLTANSSPHVLSPLAGTDMQTYLEFATQYAEEGWDGPYYYQPLYYTWFLGSLFSIFGPSVVLIFWIQSILGALTVFMCGQTAAVLGGKKAGLVSALVLCLYKNHIMYTSYALIATLQTFLLTGFFLFFVCFLKKGKFRDLLIFSVFCSLSILTRGNCILFLPFIIFFIISKYKHSPKQALKFVSVAILLIYAVQLPFSIHNYRVQKEWTGPSIASSSVLVIGNNPQAPPGTNEELYYMPNPDVLKYWNKLASDESSPVPLKSSMFRWIQSEPLKWAELKFRMLLLFFSTKESYNNINHQETVKYAPWFRFPFISFELVSVFFLAGFFSWIFGRGSRKRSLNSVMVLSMVYVGSILLFYVLSRYRLPVVPVFISIASIGFIKSRNLVVNKKRPSKRALICALLSIIVTFTAFDFYRKNAEPFIMSRLDKESPQFPIRNSIIMRDVNDHLWGGHKSFTVNGEAVLFKGFKSKKFLQAGEQEAVFFLNVLAEENNTDLTIELTHRNTTYRKAFKVHKVSGRENYLSLSFKGNFSEIEEWVSLKITAAKPVNINYTTQRDYWRSMIGDAALNGEWDAALILVDKLDSRAK